MAQDNRHPALTASWEIAGTLGEGWPQENVYIICAMAGEIWIILKNIPLTLAQHIVKVHNKSLSGN